MYVVMLKEIVVGVMKTDLLIKHLFPNALVIMQMLYMLLALLYIYIFFNCLPKVIDYIYL